MSMEFHEFANDANLSRDEFPHARLGPQKLKRFRSWLIALCVFAVSSLIKHLFVRSDDIIGSLAGSSDHDSALSESAASFSSALLELLFSIIDVVVFAGLEVGS